MTKKKTEKKVKMISNRIIKSSLVVIILLFYYSMFPNEIYYAGCLTIEKNTNCDSVKKYAFTYSDSIKSIYCDNCDSLIYKILSEIKFKNLSSIFLSDLTLKKIPDFVLSNNSLKGIVIENSALTNIPVSIKNLQSLESISIYSYNKLDITNISYLINIKEITFTNTRIEKFPDFLNKMKHLKSLSISWNKSMEGGKWFRLFNEMENLEIISISGINQKIYLQDSILRNTHLKNLTIQNSKYVGVKSILKKSSELNNIEHLGFNKCKLKKIPTDLKCFHKLKNVSITNNKFQNIPNILSENCNIEVIEAYGNKIKHFEPKCKNQKVILNAPVYNSGPNR